jgi:signal transduction histidine kinase
MMNIIWRLVRAGLVAALIVGLAGWAYERARFGASDPDALARIEAELRQRFNASADSLGRIAAGVAAQRGAIKDAPRDPAAARRLFDAVDAALPDEAVGRTGLTVYDAGGMALAWGGRASDLPKARLTDPALFAAPSALGPRLVRVEPVLESGRSQAARLATVVVEQVLGRIQGSPVLAHTFVVPTSIVPVSVSAQVGDAVPDRAPYAFVIRSRDLRPLVVAEVSPDDLAQARSRWRSRTWAAVWSVLAVTLLLCSGPLVEQRHRARDRRVFIVATGGIVLMLAAARLVFWFAAAPLVGPRTLTSPLDLLLNALVVAALAWIALDLIERRRVTSPRPHLVRPHARRIVGAAGAYAAAGAAAAVLLYAYERFLQNVVSETSLDLLHFSLHPASATRFAIAFGLVLLHASIIWSAAVLTRLPSLVGRMPRRFMPRGLIAIAWLAGALLAIQAANRLRPVLSWAPLLVVLAVAGVCAAVIAWMHGRARHASQAARLLGLFLALLAPAVAAYPSLLAFATAAKEHLVADDFGPQAASQRDDLRKRLFATLDEIDSLPAGLTDFVAGLPDVVTPTTDLAFRVWSQTDLQKYRLTSAVELYNADGRPVSRFALKLPEDAATSFRPSSCEWDLFEEVSPFGSSERHVLRASRGICDGGGTLGAIVVRVMLDPRTLPFISSQSPYLESLRPAGQLPAEGAPGRDVEFAVYGWSRAPMYASAGTSVWSLTDAVFQRLVESREPFWATLTRGEDRFRVYCLNDRGAIYALGYPVITGFGHLINLAELVALTSVLYLLLLGAATLFNALTSRMPASGRALLREIRSSFYRKLFIAFVAAAVVPVVILAFATRAYFAKQFRDGVEQAAARTATVAQRLVEDYATVQQRGPGALQTLDDQVLVLVGRAIDQDVNLFDRERLQATSERDLFASGLLTTRTPADVYRKIMLDRLPSFVGYEEVGESKYSLAAAPVRAAGREGIVTVPVTSREREIERQIDELDRRVLFAAILFSLLGSAIGYWMAERIADPVNRLTRATRRIARGDLDARIAATSSDELRRLVEDFNRMADDLKRQRTDLERTQRLEAWADMARQVAHEIKNPLTPIQLSAEHARRVNLDRGRPLSPALDDCVNAILTQVTLLRQISAEFSSFASSPTPRPEPTRLPELIEAVVEPYRAGLTGRIAIAVDAPRDLPTVTIDKTLFARALTNVIENALHAMPGRGKLVVESRESIVDSRGSTLDSRRVVIVRLTDTGVGMDDESTKRIFEPYFSTKATGTGLGLTIAKRNVELNGGTIEVASARGAGTTVTITLPVAA